MTLKQFISFIGGLVLTGLIYGLIVCIFVFATFSFAGETLSEKENRDAFFFYSSVIVISVTIYIIYRRLKTNRKFSAIGICIPLVFAFYSCFVFGYTYVGNLTYYQAFDKTKWTQSEYKPFKMVKTLIKEKVLIGQSMQQIINKLGVSNDSLRNDKVDFLKYWTDKDTWEMRLYFKNDKVVEAYLYQEGLGL